MLRGLTRVIVAGLLCSFAASYFAAFAGITPVRAFDDKLNPPKNLLALFTNIADYDTGPTFSIHFEWDNNHFSLNQGKPVFELIYSKPEGQAPINLGDSAELFVEGVFIKEKVSVADPKGINTFGIRVTKDGETSDVSKEMTIEFDGEGKFVQFTNADGTQTTREQVERGLGKPTKCGRENAAFGLTTFLPVAYCNITEFARNISIFLLRSAMNLLVVTAGLPIEQSSSIKSKSGQALLFGELTNTGFGGRIEEKLLDDDAGRVSRAAYSRILGIVNGLVLVLLIAIALANILQIQINVYSFNKLLPGLVVGLILANASFFIVRATLEISGYTATALIPAESVCVTDATGKCVPKSGAPQMLDQFELLGTATLNKEGNYTTNGGKDIDFGLVTQQAILNLALIVAAVMIFILGFLFAIRSLIFYIALPLAPFAFIGLYYPPLKFFWDRWWGFVSSWAFMNVVAFFWLWLGFNWIAATTTSAKGAGSNFFVYLINYIFGVAIIYMAMRTPFTIHKDVQMVMNNWNKVGKVAWGVSGGWALGKAGRGVKTRLYENPTTGGIIATFKNLQRLDQGGDDRLKRAEEALKTKGLFNRAASRSEQRSKQKDKEEHAETEKFEAQVRANDKKFQAISAHIEAIEDATKALDEVTEKEVKLKKNESEKLEELRHKADKYRAEAILKNRDLQKSQTRRAQDFDDHLDVGHREAWAEAEADAKQEEKIREKSVRKGIVSLEGKLGHIGYANGLLEKAATEDLSEHELNSLHSSLEFLGEHYGQSESVHERELGEQYIKVAEKVKQAKEVSGEERKNLLTADETGAAAQLKKARDKRKEEDKLGEAMEKSLIIRTAVNDTKYAADESKTRQEGGEILENVSGDKKDEFTKAYARVLLGRGYENSSADDDDHMITIGALAQGLTKQDYDPADVHAAKLAMQAIRNSEDADAKEAKKSVLDEADMEIRKAVRAFNSDDGKSNQLGFDPAKIDTLKMEDFLDEMKKPHDRAKRNKFVTALTGSRASRLLYIDKAMAKGPANARRGRKNISIDEGQTATVPEPPTDSNTEAPPASDQPRQPDSMRALPPPPETPPTNPNT